MDETATTKEFETQKQTASASESKWDSHPFPHLQSEPNSFPQPESDPFAGLPKARTITLPGWAKVLILLLMAVGAILFFLLKNMDFGGAQSTPEKTVKGFFQAVKDKDPEKMILSIDIRPEKLPEGVNKEVLLREWKKALEQESSLLISYEILSSTIDGDSAIVQYRVVLGQRLDDEQADPPTVEQAYNLNKVDQKWYIELYK
ncbi:hypothetical protein D7Z26_19965 [Cohnella endophytica]|uniref:DUF4878 domain-containing protein n=1 Tax=Cohnella endophytica TaxID=2419778 RepID=A0A494XHH6_9BACL|nr:hypothetical protein [Cohnella endophytica]RKP50090.1 hypothetical protein D7Z26_19965 [Cohnella endophytica]